MPKSRKDADKQLSFDFEPEPPKVRTARYRPPDDRSIYAFVAPSVAELERLTAGDEGGRG